MHTRLIVPGVLYVFPALALAAAGDVVPLQPAVPNASVGMLEVIGNGTAEHTRVVVQLNGVARENTPFHNNLSVQFYSASGGTLGFRLPVPADRVSDARGNDDGDIDNHDILELDVTGALQFSPAGSYAMDVIYTDPGGDGDSMFVHSDGFPLSADNSDDLDRLYRIIDSAPEISYLTRWDSDGNGVDDTVSVHAAFPTLGYGVNREIRGSFAYAAVAGEANPNASGDVDASDWEKDTGGGFVPFSGVDVVGSEPVRVGDRSVSFRFDEALSDLSAPGAMDRVRASVLTDLRDGTGNVLLGDSPTAGVLCLDGEGLASDCNGNGVCDRDEIATGMVRDCDGNGVPDVCDLLAGANDVNNNGVLDTCEFRLIADLDGDGVVGPRDLARLLAAWGPVVP